MISFRDVRAKASAALEEIPKFGIKVRSTAASIPKWKGRAITAIKELPGDSSEMAVLQFIPYINSGIALFKERAFAQSYHRLGLDHPETIQAFRQREITRNTSFVGSSIPFMFTIVLMLFTPIGGVIAGGIALSSLGVRLAINKYYSVPETDKNKLMVSAKLV
jgi:hypothetical protein